MAGDLFKVHHETTDGEGNVRITRTTPYLSVRQGHNPPLFLKQGAVFSSSGALEEKPPPWLLNAMKSLDSKALESVGFDPERVRTADTLEYALSKGKGK